MKESQRNVNALGAKKKLPANFLASGAVMTVELSLRRCKKVTESKFLGAFGNVTVRVEDA